MVWAEFFDRQSPPSTMANPACIATTRKPAISNQWLPERIIGDTILLVFPQCNCRASRQRRPVPAAPSGPPKCGVFGPLAVSVAGAISPLAIPALTPLPRACAALDAHPRSTWPANKNEVILKAGRLFVSPWHDTIHGTRRTRCLAHAAGLGPGGPGTGAGRAQPDGRLRDRGRRGDHRRGMAPAVRRATRRDRGPEDRRLSGGGGHDVRHPRTLLPSG